MLDNDNDLDILDNIQAANLDEPKPAQEEPFAHIPEEEIRNLDTLLVDIPAAESIASKLPVIRAAIESIEATGRISHAQAQEIAVEVPTIFGTKEDPVAYSTQPTGAGVQEAVGILKDEESTIIKALRERVKAIAEDKLSELSLKIKESKGNYLKASSDFMQARKAFFDATGENPETAVNTSIGNTAVSAALYNRTRFSTETAEVAQTSTAFQLYLDAIKEILGPAISGVETLCSDKPFISLGTAGAYELDDLVCGEIECDTIEATGIGYLNWLMAIPMITLDKDEYDGQADLFSAVLAAVETLTHQLTDDTEDLYSETNSAELQKNISKISLKISVIDELLACSLKFSEVATASNSFLMRLVESATVQTSMATENIDQPAKHKSFNILTSNKRARF